MNKLNVFDWSKKTRTVLRSVKPGDIFMLEVRPGLFATGRIMSKVDFGHVAELLDIFVDKPQLSPEILLTAKRIGHPIVLDSYSLFDKKLAGDWRIIAHEEGYVPPAHDKVFFSYGAGASFKKVDIFGNEVGISKADADKLPIYSPKEDWDVKEILAPCLK